MKTEDFKKLKNTRKRAVKRLLEKYDACDIFDDMVIALQMNKFDAYESNYLHHIVVSYLTERGYNVIKTTSLKEQMELEDWVARQYPKINQRENLFLTL